MKIVIDTERIKASELSISKFLYLLSFYLKDPITLSDLEWQQGKPLYLDYPSVADPKEHSGKVYVIKGQIGQNGADIIEDIILNSEFKSTDQVIDRWDALAEKLRNLYPQGKKEGTAYMWRDSTKIIAKRLRALVKKYGDVFTDEQAINATKRYVESFNGNYTYMQLLKYFIIKRVNKDGEIEETSQLLSYIENEGQSDVNNDWVNEVI